MALGSVVIAYMSDSELTLRSCPLWLLLIYLGQIGVWGPPAFLGSGVVAARVRPAWESDCPGLCAASLLTCWDPLGQVTQFPHL